MFFNELMNLQPSTVTNPAYLSQYHFGKAGLSSIDSYKGFSEIIGSIYSSIDFELLAVCAVLGCFKLIIFWTNHFKIVVDQIGQ